jgi:hypothetical protein
VQKLAYFLQRLGEPLKLKFEKGQYGPFAHNLSFVLQRMDGAFLRGMDFKEAKAFAELTLIEEKFPEIESYIAQHLTEQQQQQISYLAQLIEGFESPLGMELLATVDYLLDTREAQDLNSIINAVGNWNPRKKKILTPDYLNLAYGRLTEHPIQVTSVSA